MKVATDYGEHGEPIYTTTVRLKCGELIETDIDARNESLNRATDELRQRTGLDIARADVLDAEVSDMFFNCEAANDNPDYTDTHKLLAAARKFHAELLPQFQERYSVPWLVQDYLDRV